MPLDLRQCPTCCACTQVHSHATIATRHAAEKLLMASNEDTCLSDAVAQQHGSNGMHQLDSKQQPSSEALDPQVAEVIGAHLPATMEAAEVPVPSLSSAVEPSGSPQAGTTHAAPTQALPLSDDTEVATDGQNEPVRTQPKQSAKLQPTAALVYPWISASMRRSGTGTASFRTVSEPHTLHVPRSPSQLVVYNWCAAITSVLFCRQQEASTLACLLQL